MHGGDNTLLMIIQRYNAFPGINPKPFVRSTRVTHDLDYCQTAQFSLYENLWFCYMSTWVHILKNSTWLSCVLSCVFSLWSTTMTSWHPWQWRHGIHGNDVMRPLHLVIIQFPYCSNGPPPPLSLSIYVYIYMCASLCLSTTTTRGSLTVRYQLWLCSKITPRHP